MVLFLIFFNLQKSYYLNPALHGEKKEDICCNSFPNLRNIIFIWYDPEDKTATITQVHTVHLYDHDNRTKLSLSNNYAQYTYQFLNKVSFIHNCKLTKDLAIAWFPILSNVHE